MTTKNTKEVAVKKDNFTSEEIELIKNTIAKGTSDQELKLFMMVAKRSGLDPFSHQIYYVKRGTTGTIQTGIDGYRLIADRTGLYAGNDEPKYDTLPDRTGTEKHPNSATTTVYKIVSGQRYPFSATARWNEYAQSFNGKLGTMWEKMPYVMLAKCSEALALRKAFPQELSGMYTSEEMQQAGVIDVTDTQIDMPPVPATKTPTTSAQKVAKKEDGVYKQRIVIALEKLGFKPREMSKDQLASIILANTGHELGDEPMMYGLVAEKLEKKVKELSTK